MKMAKSFGSRLAPAAATSNGEELCRLPNKTKQTPKMIGTKELAVLILFFSSTSWGCFGGSGAPEGAVSDFCQICTDMVTKANEMDIMESEEYLRHVSWCKLWG